MSAAEQRSLCGVSPAPLTMPFVFQTDDGTPVSTDGHSKALVRSTERSLGLTNGAADLSTTTQRPSTRRRSLWVCAMLHDQHSEASTQITEATQMAASQAGPPSQAGSASDTSSVISSHSGSFNASLRLGQQLQHSRDASRYHHQQQQRTTSSGAAAGGGGVIMSGDDVFSPISQVPGYSDHASNGSYEADIINFDFSFAPTTATTTTTTPMTATPATAASGTRQAWAASPSSPFSPFTPCAVMKQPCGGCLFLRDTTAAATTSKPPVARSFPSVSFANADREKPPHDLSFRPAKASASAATSTASCPQTPEQFMAWRRDLVEARRSTTEEAQTDGRGTRNGKGRSAASSGSERVGEAFSPSLSQPLSLSRVRTKGRNAPPPLELPAAHQAPHTRHHHGHRHSVPASPHLHHSARSCDRCAQSAASSQPHGQWGLHPLCTEAQASFSSRHSTPYSMSTSRRTDSGFSSRSGWHGDVSTAAHNEGRGRTDGPRKEDEERRTRELGDAVILSPWELTVIGALVGGLLLYMLCPFLFIDIVAFVTW